MMHLVVVRTLKIEPTNAPDAVDVDQLDVAALSAEQLELRLTQASKAANLGAGDVVEPPAS